MRFYGIALLAGAAILGACGGEQSATDSAAANAASATATPSTATATPGTTGAAPAAGAVAAAPVTGTTHEVKMIGDASGYKYVPEKITVKSGDAIKYVMVSGAPHNVSFQGVTDAAIRAQFDANMPGQKMGEANGPMVMQPNESYTVSFGKIPPGTYEYVCVPHLAMNMKATVTVQ
jgi:plastocyanin